MPLNQEDLQRCMELLQKVAELDPDSPAYLKLERAAAFLRKTAKKKRRLQRKKVSASKDHHLLQQTTLSESRFGTVTVSQEVETPDKATSLIRQRYCYSCKKPYRNVHHYYHQLCQNCGDRTLSLREENIDLQGRRALVTGGRIKIGFAVALRLLRFGAEVYITTRFPHDAAKRFSQESDWDSWRHRLNIYGADFRRLEEFLQLIDHWRQGQAFDILVNNAAQTVWRPPAYYNQLWDQEKLLGQKQLPQSKNIHYAQKRVEPAAEIGDVSLFPRDIKDLVGNPLDLRRENSWVQKLEEVQPLEMIECQVVNNIAPFLLCSQLKANMMNSTFEQRFIINVSAVEGQFARSSKPPRHPHTNMAKAALNMLTRTSAQDYAKDNIFMVSVDPGWVSNEGPVNQVEKARQQGFHPPLEMIDAAVRVLDPISQGVAGDPIYGVLLKNFQEVPW